MMRLRAPVSGFSCVRVAQSRGFILLLTTLPTTEM